MARRVFTSAVRQFWAYRTRQGSAGTARDVGRRSEATGGKQMDGFVETLRRSLTRDAGAPADSIHTGRSAVTLPGWFRPTKQWDLLVVVDGKLIAAIEFKAHVGPSFGNNFNNRSEEAIGSAFDFRHAAREGAFQISPRPWLGYLMLVEECAASTKPVSSLERHFPVFGEFKEASYVHRYELLCRKLVGERCYDSACLLSTPRPGAPARVGYREPARELGGQQFVASLVGHVETALTILAG